MNTYESMWKGLAWAVILSPLKFRPQGGRMEQEGEKQPVHPDRIKAFATFFKNYMSVSSIVAAALPIPVTALKLIPVYHSQAKVLSVYTPMLCFLLLAFIFYIRHPLARAVFPERFGADGVRASSKALIVRSLPLVLIVACVGSILGYHATLTRSVNAAGVSAMVSPSAILLSFED